jgi:Zn finger protein HypA/HybF involved in hydrogenase expression
MSSSEIECPHCGSTFDPDLQAGFCTDCGRKHPDYKTGDGGGGGTTSGAGSGDGDGTENLQTPGGDGNTGGAGESDAVFSCPNCGNTDVEPGDQFCTGCGEDLSDVDAEPESEPEPASPTCPNCGTEVAADASFCSNCGQELSDVGGGDTAGDTTDDVSGPTPTPGDSGPEQVAYEVGGERVEAEFGQPIGREVREALLNAGHDMDEARLIHREHVEFQNRDGSVYLVDHGRNSTVLEGESLEEGDEREIADGDSLELSSTARGTIHID